MHRFYLPPAETKRDLLLLNDSDAHHASHVLRLRRGDPLMVLDGGGTELHCEVESSDRKRVQVKVLSRKTIDPLPCAITLFQAIPKGKIIESIIQKATELGVMRIVPLMTERVTTRLDEEGAENKREKWQQVAIEAIKQCGSAWLPRIEPPLSLEDYLKRTEPFDLSLIASLQPGSRHAGEYFSDYKTRHAQPPATVAIWIGPEGDFTPAEVAAVEAVGALPITLGRLVLRVETATTYCLSIVNHELHSPRD